MNLSPNFTLEELCYSDTAIRNNIDNSVPISLHGNLSRLCLLLEQVRKVIAKPIHINSAYRCSDLNKLVKGQPNSQHMFGCAADIRITGMTPDEIIKAIIASDIQFDQMIREFDSWVHISVTNRVEDTPRNQILIIDKSGTRSYS
jgi:zinc D-Ala-D-Ala carboxypeptidase